jgi:hypothetical protein
LDLLTAPMFIISSLNQILVDIVLLNPNLLLPIQLPFVILESVPFVLIFKSVSFVLISAVPLTLFHMSCFLKTLVVVDCLLVT